MRGSKRCLVLPFIAFCAIVNLETDVAQAAGCGSAKLTQESSCGCLGWMTLVWNPNQDCTGVFEDDYLCAAAVCHLACSMTDVDEIQGCELNQYGSWLGFRCASEPCGG
jgi:hypothetical protein